MNFLKNFTKNKKILVTHDGSFHADDVFACATLCLLLKKRGERFKIIRTRDEKLIEKGDYVFDIGGIYNSEKNRFDHHQGNSPKRENSVPYSSFGLVWKKYGKELCGSEEIAERFDKRLIQTIDALDNGFDIYTPIIPELVPYGIYDVVSAFRPSFQEKNPDYDKAFLKLQDFAKNLIHHEIEKAKDQEDIHKYISQKIKEKDPESKILILEKHIPRIEIYLELIDFPDILYVIVSENENGERWKVLSLPNNTNFFKHRKFLPKVWAGLRNEELQKVTGVNGALFCHKGLFLAVAESKEDAVKLAELALLESNN